MSSPHSAADFYAAVDPVMNRTFYGLETKHKKQWNKIYEEGSDDEVQRSFVEYGGPASLQLKPENEPASSRRITQGPVKTFTTSTFAAATTISFEAVSDTKKRYSKIAGTAGSLGRASVITPELLTGLQLDRAFNSSYPITAFNKEMCSTSQLLPDGVTTYANAMATPQALDETAMENIHIALRTMTGPDGNIMPLSVKKWVVPSALTVQVWKLLNTGKQVGSANNTESYVANKGEAITFDFLSSSTRYFAITDSNETGLFWDWIHKPKIIDDQVVMNLQKTYVAFFRARYGIGDPRTIFGVAAT